MSFKITIKNKKKVQPAAIKSVVKVLFFVFLCGFTNLVVAQNVFKGLYSKDNVQIEGKQFIYHKESETQKASEIAFIYVAENTFVSGLNTTNNIQIVVLKENNLEEMVSNQVSEKAKGIKAKSKTTFKHQITAIPFENTPFKHNNSFTFYAIASSTHKNKKSSLEKTASLTNASLFNKAEIALPKEKLSYSFLKAKPYSLQTTSKHVTRPPPVV